MDACEVEGEKLQMDKSICSNCGRCVDKCYFDAIVNGTYGYKVFIGGKGGKVKTEARALNKVFTSKEEIFDLIEKALLFYMENGQPKERFAKTIERIGFEEVEKEFRAQLTFLKAMGAKIIGASEQSHSVQGMQDTPIFGHKYVMNDEEWDTFCTGMNKLGKIAKEEYGISLTFHHHMGTVVQNPDEVERMMENTDPEYVSLLFDTGHFTYCGADPLEMVKKYVSRIKHVHLKDIRPEVVEKVKNENLSFLEGVRLGTFTVPGDGCIDFDPIFKVLEDAGYEGYMLVEAEQDPAKANPLEYAIKARKFIAEKTGL